VYSGGQEYRTDLLQFQPYNSSINETAINCKKAKDVEVIFTKRNGVINANIR
jgi:hypothetical protein